MRPKRSSLRFSFPKLFSPLVLSIIVLAVIGAAIWAAILIPQNKQSGLNPTAKVQAAANPGEIVVQVYEDKNFTGLVGNAYSSTLGSPATTVKLQNTGRTVSCTGTTDATGKIIFTPGVNANGVNCVAVVGGNYHVDLDIWDVNAGRNETAPARQGNLASVLSYCSYQSGSQIYSKNTMQTLRNQDELCANAGIVLNPTGTGIDLSFGYNFDTVFSTNSKNFTAFDDNYRGTLSNFIDNANFIEGDDKAIFNIKSTAQIGSLTTITNTITSGVARISNPAGGTFPVVENMGGGTPLSDKTIMDGAVQTVTNGDLNPGQITMDAVTLNRPEIEIYTQTGVGSSTLKTNNRANLQIKNVSLYGVGALVDNSSATNGVLTVDSTLLGIQATAVSATGTTDTNDFSNLSPIPTGSAFLNQTCINSGLKAQISSNLIRCWNGVRFESLTNNPTAINITNNDFSVANSGIAFNKYSSASNSYAGGIVTITGNNIQLQSIVDNGSPRLSKDGIHFESKSNPSATGPVIIQNNKIQGINIVADNGIYINGNTANGSTNITRLIQQNTFNSLQAGIMVTNNSGTDGVKMLSNIFQGSLSIPVDLVSNGVVDGVTPNDGLLTGYTAGTPGNQGYDFPFLTTTTILGSTITLKGCVLPGSQIEFYQSVSGVLSPLFGSIFTEGTPADTDTSTNATCGQSVAGTPYNNFSFNIPLGITPIGVSLRALATNPATGGPNSAIGPNSTSEFGNTTTLVNTTPALSCQRIYLFDGNTTIPANVGLMYEYNPGVTVNGASLPVALDLGTDFKNAAGIMPDLSKIFYNATTNAAKYYNISAGTVNGIPSSPSYVSARGAVDLAQKYWSINSTGSLFGFTTGTIPALNSITPITYSTATVASDGGGDIAISSSNRAFFVTNSNQFFAINLSTAVASYLGQVTGIASTLLSNSLAFGADGSLYVGGSTNPSPGTGFDLYKLNLQTLSATLVWSNPSHVSVDASSCAYPLVNPTPILTKNWYHINGANATTGLGGSRDSAVSVNAGDVMEYEITLRNTGNQSMPNTTLQDAIPTGTSYFANTTITNGTATTDVGSAMPYVTAAQIQTNGQVAGLVLPDPTPLTINPGADNEVVVKFRVQVNSPIASVPNPIVNTAAVNYQDAPAATTAQAQTPLFTNPPIANGDASTIFSNVTGIPTAATLDVVLNDTDVEDANSLLKISSIAGVPVPSYPFTTSFPNTVSVSIAADGRTVTVVPTLNFIGTLTIPYIINDTYPSTSNVANYIVTVQNRSPNAVINTYTLLPNSLFAANQLSVLTNDTDPENQTLSIATPTTIGSPTSLSGVARKNGLVIEYQPLGGTIGTDTFSYTISDGNGGTSTATVTITLDCTATGNLNWAWDASAGLCKTLIGSPNIGQCANKRLVIGNTYTCDFALTGDTTGNGYLIPVGGLNGTVFNPPYLANGNACTLTTATNLQCTLIPTVGGTQGVKTGGTHLDNAGTKIINKGNVELLDCASIGATFSGTTPAITCICPPPTSYDFTTHTCINPACPPNSTGTLHPSCVCNVGYGTYNPATNTCGVFTCPAGATQIAGPTCVCPAGSQYNSSTNTCNACIGNTYSNTSTGNVCVICTSFVNTAHTACAICNNIAGDGIPDCVAICDYDTSVATGALLPNCINCDQTADNGIDFCPINQPPVANNDTAALVPNTSISIPVVANDTDPDNSFPLTVSTITQNIPVAQGVLTIVGGAVQFTPATNYVGSVVFKYKPQDSFGLISTNDATVTITVACASGLSFINGRCSLPLSDALIGPCVASLTPVYVSVLFDCTYTLGGSSTNAYYLPINTYSGLENTPGTPATYLGDSNACTIQNNGTLTATLFCPAIPTATGTSGVKTNGIILKINTSYDPKGSQTLISCDAIAGNTIPDCLAACDYIPGNAIVDCKVCNPVGGALPPNCIACDLDPNTALPLCAPGVCDITPTDNAVEQCPTPPACDNVKDNNVLDCIKACDYISGNATPDCIVCDNDPATSYVSCPVCDYDPATAAPICHTMPECSNPTDPRLVDDAIEQCPKPPVCDEIPNNGVPECPKPIVPPTGGAFLISTIFAIAVLVLVQGARTSAGRRLVKPFTKMSVRSTHDIDL